MGVNLLPWVARKLHWKLQPATNTKKAQGNTQGHPQQAVNTESHEVEQQKDFSTVSEERWDDDSKYTMVAKVTASDPTTEQGERRTSFRCLRATKTSPAPGHRSGSSPRGQASSHRGRGSSEDTYRERVFRTQRDKQRLAHRLAKITKSRERLACELSRAEDQLSSSEKNNAAIQESLESRTRESSRLRTQVASMADENEMLAREISASRLELEGQMKRLGAAETHIMNLGSSFAVLLSREDAASMFKGLLEQTKTWIAEFVSPAIENASDRLEVVRHAHQSGIRDRLLRPKYYHSDRKTDFQLASSFPNADEDIMLAMIFDFLSLHIFSAKTLYGGTEPSLEKQVQLFQDAENTMELTMKTAKSLYNARRWASQAKMGLLRGPQVDITRQTFADLTSDRLMAELGHMFVADRTESSSQENTARFALRNNIILPAIAMQDRILCAIDRFTIERHDYRPSPRPTSPSFFDDLPSLNCKNLGNGPRRFRPDKIKEKLSTADIQRRLRKICATTPALVLRETGDREFGPPITLVRQEMLVAWDQPENPAPMREEEGVFSMLYRKWIPADTASEVQSSGLSSIFSR